MADVTLPGTKPAIGHAHVLTQTVDAICEIFGRMGFEVVYGPEVEDERHNFEALNIPASHPARDPLDNFYIDDETMLRSQTSTVQIRTMETRQPPVRVIAPGRVYRPDTVDATHSFMFHQVEGLYVDEGVTMVDLKTCLDQFCKAYFGSDVQTRFRPSFFPFTEPSAEVDLLFHFPEGSTQWIELGGCGMVDPNVLEAVGYDAEKYTGFAFGLGIERMAMRRHAIPDIRLLFENDVRFLHQF
jgi:phenylalanyl-tRNA synthetase alpha chain